MYICIYIYIYIYIHTHTHTNPLPRCHLTPAVQELLGDVHRPDEELQRLCAS